MVPAPGSRRLAVATVAAGLLLGLAGCGGEDAPSREFHATDQVPPGGSSRADLEATSEALAAAVRAFGEDEQGAVPTTVRLRTLTDGEGSIRGRGEAG